MKVLVFFLRHSAKHDNGVWAWTTICCITRHPPLIAPLYSQIDHGGSCVWSSRDREAMGTDGKWALIANRHLDRKDNVLVSGIAPQKVFAPPRMALDTREGYSAFAGGALLGPFFPPTVLGSDGVPSSSKSRLRAENIVYHSHGST
jgi:hypothetical protein